MPTRKYKTNPAQLLAEGQLIVKSTEDAIVNDIKFCT